MYITFAWNNSKCESIKGCCCFFLMCERIHHPVNVTQIAFKDKAMGYNYNFSDYSSVFVHCQRAALRSLRHEAARRQHDKAVRESFMAE